MASEVDICNLALAMLGDEATVASIKPPEGSAQAQHCARFYPIARNSLLELHAWGFATVRTALSPLDTAPSTWAYAYATPSDAINLLAVLDAEALDDFSVNMAPLTVQSTLAVQAITPTSGNGSGLYTPQPFEAETQLDGSQIILTNQPNAVLRYTRAVTDPTKFTPLFTQALSVLLASHLAGPVLKGAEGRAASATLRNEVLNTWLPRAAVSDANQRRLQITQNVPWITGR